MIAGDNGISTITHFDSGEYRCKVAAEVRQVDGFGIPERDCYATPPPLATLPNRHVRRGVNIFLACAKEAFGDSGLAESGVQAASVGVAAGASVAFLDHELTADYYRLRRSDGSDFDMARFAQEGAHPAYMFHRGLGDLAASLPAKVLGLGGPTMVMDTACAASGHAIGAAFRLVRQGSVKAMVAGGACAAVSPLGILYFAILGALSQNEDPESASRPFDRQRDGFVMGEGGGAVVLEDYEHALARGARVYAELAGFGSNTCAFNLTDPSPDGVIEEQAMRTALQDGSVAPEEVGYVAAHGTSTPKNDATESKAIARLFGARAKDVLVSSNKAQIGHTISGAAVSNLIMAVMAIYRGVVPPTMHLRNRDPELDLDFVPNQARDATIPAALVNSFAFGGQNAVLSVRAVA
jgi:3-oxoacyl-[acyl-carrier-protein] synthase II